MTEVEVSRTAVLRHRVGAHQLGKASVTLPECDVLGVGVRDNPVGATASLALRTRRVDAEEADTALVCAYSVRSALHVHRRSDVAQVRAALRWSDGDEPAEQTYGPMVSRLGAADLDVQTTTASVVSAMVDVMSDGVPRTKSELSTDVTDRVSPAEAPWCPGCSAHHVDDALFRHATLLAGLVAVAGSGRSFQLHILDEESTEPAPHAARSALVRRYLHLAGAATPAQFATWVGMRQPVVKRWWALLEDEVIPVRVDGTRMWALGTDVESLRAPASAAGGGLHLLPPYDPFTEIADRTQLVPTTEHRRRVWRAARNPGVVLRDGEVAGIWRDRRKGKARSVTIEPFAGLTARQERSAAAAAERLLGPAPVTVTFA